MTKPILTQARLKELVRYNKTTGVFNTIKRSPWTTNGEITAKHQKGYLTHVIDGHRYYLHRLAYLYVMGEFPDQIDHINRTKDDNRWDNLRNVSNGTNHRNMPMNIRNKSGVTGVHWSKKSKKWCAQIKFRGKRYSLGVFIEIEDAAKARKKAEKEYGFHPSHGIST